MTAAGQSVGYSFLVTNTGNVTLTGVRVAETAFSGTGTEPVASCAPTTLAPGASVTCTATYAVTQADVDAGSVTNTATASGTDPTSGTVTSTPSSAAVSATAAGALTVLKSASPTTVTAAGQSVGYSFLVTNTGNVTVSGVGITETGFSGSGTVPAASCPVPVLAPGASTTCTAAYAVTQADVDAGSVTNTATASGLTPSGAAVVSGPSSAAVAVTRSGALTLVKSATPATVTAAGDTVRYSFLVTNSGNVTLTGVGVTETAFSGTGTAPVASCPTTTLAPGASVTCTATYAVTQADVDAGSVTNTATASGTPPSGGPVVSGPSSATVSATGAAALRVVKSASPTTVTAAGQSVGYSFAVTNTGNVTLTGVAITETAFGGSGTRPVATCPVTTLAPGASTTCTAGYTVTQADVDAGSVTNTATASGTGPSGTPATSGPSSATVTATEAAALTLVKSASPSVVAAAGDPVSYSFLVTNSGNVTLTGVGVTETAFSGTGSRPVATCPTTTLAPGASVSCTATYPVTQADVDAGSVTNTATASGTPPSGGPVVSGPSSAAVSATRAAALSLVKSASPTTVTAAGQPVTYTFLVTNTGNVTTTAVGITETAFSGTGPAPVATCPTTTLAPGASVSCTATYPVTQADVDEGSVTNTATASGSGPTGARITSGASSAIVSATRTRELTLVKSASPTTVTAVGDPVQYSFLVTNSGNVTLSGVTIAETAFSGTGPVPAATCPTVALAPGAALTCTATYPVTQGDIDAGSVSNTATATATGPSGIPATSGPSTATVTATRAAALTLVKSVAPTTVDAAGVSVTYSFAVTNTGNVTLTSVGINESRFSGTARVPGISCPTTPLAPGATLTCTATYTVSQRDVDAGSVTNTATATATDLSGDPVSSGPSSATVTATRTAALTLVKSASPTTVTRVGQLVHYSYLVTNAGNVTLAAPAIAETAFSGTGTAPVPSCPPQPLAPDASTTCTATYPVTQADIEAGSVTNTATASASAPTGGPVVSGPSSATVTAVRTAALSLLKSAAPTTVNAAGDPVGYRFVVTNTGNVTLTGVRVAETAFSGTGTAPVPGCPTAPLAPNASATCTANYRVTQADIDAGSVTNTAIATATGPDLPLPRSQVSSNPSSAIVTAQRSPALTIAKSATPTRVTAAGQPVRYRFLVTNTGNVTLSGVGVVETVFSGRGAAPVPSCPVATLAPGATVTCGADYTVARADLAAASISNTATARATAPGGGKVVSGPSTAKVTVSPVVKPVRPEPTNPLPGTGTQLLFGTLGLALLLLAVGLPLVWAARQRRHGRRG